MTAILCTNGLQSKTLAAVRSIGRHGVRCIVAEKSKFHMSGFSKYASAVLTYPDPTKYPDDFFEWLCNTIVQHQCDLLLPMDDDVMSVVVERQDALRRLCHIPVPSREAYQYTADKAMTMRLAEQQNVSYPETIEMNLSANYDDEEIFEVMDRLKYPVVVKPRVSSGSRGVRTVYNSTDFLEIFREIHRYYPNPIIQEKIPYGGKYGVCLCFDDNHQLKGAFVYQEVRNFPRERGPSTVRQSVLRPDLVDLTIRLMKGIPWYGVVEVDYMIDARTGEPILMEVNPRYWASLHIAIECGVDFPWIQYCLESNRPFKSVENYAVNVLGRQLFPGDFLYYLAHSGCRKIKPSFFSTRYHDDMLSRDDPAPLFGFMLSVLRFILDSKMWKFLITR